MTLKAKHILLNHEFEAKDVLRKLNEGESFEALAKAYSICSSSKQGGDLGEFPKGRMVETFEKALLKLKDQEVSGITKTAFGYHIIKRIF